MCLNGETCTGYSLTSAIGFVLLDVNHASTLPSPREQHKSPRLSGLVFRHITSQEDLGVRTQSWVWILIHFLPSGIKQVLLPFKVHFLACELKIAVSTSWKECQGQNRMWVVPYYPADPPRTQPLWLIEVPGTQWRSFLTCCFPSPRLAARRHHSSNRWRSGG